MKQFQGFTKFLRRVHQSVFEPLRSLRRRLQRSVLSLLLSLLGVLRGNWLVSPARLLDGLGRDRWYLVRVLKFSFPHHRHQTRSCAFPMEQ